MAPNVVHYRSFDAQSVEVDAERQTFVPPVYLQGPEMVCESCFQSDGALWCKLLFDKLDTRSALRDMKGCLEAIENTHNTTPFVHEEAMYVQVSDKARVEDRETNEDMRVDEIRPGVSRVVPVLLLKHTLPFRGKWYVPLVASILKVRTPEEQTKVDVPDDDVDTE